MTFSVRRSPRISSPRLTGRNTYPSVNPTEDVHASMALFTQVGIGIVRTRPCFPTRIAAENVSEVKGLVNRCVRQDQWDWFTVFARFGAPDPAYLRVVSALLPDLRKAILDNDAEQTGHLREQLNWTALLNCCLNFLGEQSNLELREGEPAAGQLYVPSTREHPDLLKIGFTTRSVEERVKEINSATGVVSPSPPAEYFA